MLIHFQIRNKKIWKQKSSVRKVQNTKRRNYEIFVVSKKQKQQKRKRKRKRDLALKRRSEKAQFVIDLYLFEI